MDGEPQEMTKRYRVHVSGRVQGVYFRANCRETARSLGLKGWVRNLPDGRVEAVFEGDEKAAEAMLGWCRTGTPPARVDRIEVKEETPAEGLAGFEIVY